MGTSFRLGRVANQYTVRFRVILPAGGLSHAYNPFSLGALLLRLHHLPVFVKAIQIFICVINVSTRNINAVESIESLSCFNASGEFN